MVLAKQLKKYRKLFSQLNPRWQKYLPLAVIVLFAFITRVWHLSYPNRYMFDEVYHVVTAKLIQTGNPDAFDWHAQSPEPDTAIDWLHPPIAKYTQAASMAVLGQNSFGWRFSSAVFGTGVILATYALSMVLFKKHTLALLASFLASLDGLLLVQSRIAMNDIHVTLFILLTLLATYKALEEKTERWLWLTGIFAGLAISSKWSGAFALAMAGGLIGVTWLKKNMALLPKWQKIEWLEAGKIAVALIVVPVTIYLASYTPIFIQGDGWKQLVGLHQQIWWYQTNLDASHSYQSQPWQWFINARPVWYFVEYGRESISNIYAQGNIILHSVGVLIVVMSTPLLLARVGHKKSKHVPPLLFTLVAYFFVWLPWTISPRIMFYYHYAPAVPLLCIIIAFWLHKMWSENTKQNRVFVALFLLAASISFIVWLPNWIGLPVTQNFADTVYFGLSSWK